MLPSLLLENTPAKQKYSAMLIINLINIIYKISLVSFIDANNLVYVKKGKGVCKLFMEIHLTATECHLPYGITQCYLPLDTSENTPPLPQPDRLVLDLPTI